MSRFWPKLRHTAALLLAIAAMGHAQLVLACASTSSGSQRGPCCPPEIQQPAGADTGCEKRVSERTSDCAAVFDLVPAQPALADHLSAHDAGDSLDVEIPSPVWPTPPVTAHLRPPPLGPPVPVAATLPGKHTYLATLRLRI